MIDHLLASGYNVQLQHTEKETTWEDHGFVRILIPSSEEGEGEGEEVAFSAKVQHNRNKFRQEELLALGNTAMQIHKEKQGL